MTAAFLPCFSFPCDQTPSPFAPTSISRPAGLSCAELSAAVWRCSLGGPPQPPHPRAARPRADRRPGRALRHTLRAPSRRSSARSPCKPSRRPIASSALRWGCFLELVEARRALCDLWPHPDFPFPSRTILSFPLHFYPSLPAIRSSLRLSPFTQKRVWTQLWASAQRRSWRASWLLWMERRCNDRLLSHATTFLTPRLPPPPLSDRFACPSSHSSHVRAGPEVLEGRICSMALARPPLPPRQRPSTCRGGGGRWERGGYASVGRDVPRDV